jgi:hypothetical protein
MMVKQIYLRQLSFDIYYKSFGLIQMNIVKMEIVFTVLWWYNKNSYVRSVLSYAINHLD